MVDADGVAPSLLSLFAPDEDEVDDDEEDFEEDDEWDD